MSEDSSRRWRAERGASLSMALLFILVAAMVGFVIVTAASVLTGRAVSSGGISRTVADQRQYVLRSTARLIQEELVGEYGAYVCLEKEYEGGSLTRAQVRSDLLTDDSTPVFTINGGHSSASPATVLEYLACQGSPAFLPGSYGELFPASNLSLSPHTYNQWSISPGNAEPGTPGVDYEFTRDILVKLSSSDLDQTLFNAVKGSNPSAKEEVQILCRLRADRYLNITAEVGFCSGWVEGSIHTSTTANTFAGETITFQLPVTRTDFPESTYTDPETGTTTSTTRAMYVWQVA